MCSKNLWKCEAEIFFKKIETIGEEDKNKKNISIFLKSKKKKSCNLRKEQKIYVSIKIYESVKLKNIFFFS